LYSLTNSAVRFGSQSIQRHLFLLIVTERCFMDKQRNTICYLWNIWCRPRVSRKSVIWDQLVSKIDRRVQRTICSSHLDFWSILHGQPSDDLHRTSRTSREPDYGTYRRRAFDIWPTILRPVIGFHRSKPTVPDPSCSWIVVFSLHEAYSSRPRFVLGLHHFRWVLEINQCLLVHDAPWGIGELSDPRRCTMVVLGILWARPCT